jgi:hypothetical protein
VRNYLSGFLLFVAAGIVFAAAASAGGDDAEYPEENKAVGNEEIIVKAPHS